VLILQERVSIRLVYVRINDVRTPLIFAVRLYLSQSARTVCPKLVSFRVWLNVYTYARARARARAFVYVYVCM